VTLTGPNNSNPIRAVEVFDSRSLSRVPFNSKAGYQDWMTKNMPAAKKAVCLSSEEPLGKELACVFSSFRIEVYIMNAEEEQAFFCFGECLNQRRDRINQVNWITRTSLSPQLPPVPAPDK
jgi:hypothetical protein